LKLGEKEHFLPLLPPLPLLFSLLTSPQQKREGLVEYPQINIKLLSEEDRELVKQAKQRAEELRLTFKEFVLDCIRNELSQENPDSADSATAAEIEALKVQIAALSEKVSIPSATKSEVHTLQERLNQLRVGISNEIKKDREQLASLALALSRLESQIEQLVPSLQVDGEGNADSDSNWLFGEDSGAELPLT
jgi:chromosome segregation ATPase